MIVVVQTGGYTTAYTRNIDYFLYCSYYRGDVDWWAYTKYIHDFIYCVDQRGDISILVLVLVTLLHQFKYFNEEANLKMCNHCMCKHCMVGMAEVINQVMKQNWVKCPLQLLCKDARTAPVKTYGEGDGVTKYDQKTWW